MVPSLVCQILPILVERETTDSEEFEDTELPLEQEDGDTGLGLRLRLNVFFSLGRMPFALCPIFITIPGDLCPEHLMRCGICW